MNNSMTKRKLLQRLGHASNLKYKEKKKNICALLLFSDCSLEVYSGHLHVYVCDHCELKFEHNFCVKLTQISLVTSAWFPVRI